MLLGTVVLSFGFHDANILIFLYITYGFPKNQYFCTYKK